MNALPESVFVIFFRANSAEVWRVWATHFSRREAGDDERECKKLRIARHAQMKIREFSRPSPTDLEIEFAIETQCGGTSETLGRCAFVEGHDGNCSSSSDS